MSVADPPRSLDQTRNDLAQEWYEAAPSTPEQVAEFYRTSKFMEADLDTWHVADAERKTWTKVLTHVASQVVHAQTAIDVGSGAGHDLAALRVALGKEAALYGVEPNEALRTRSEGTATMVADVALAPIERADVLSCFDVLEHVPDPGAWLSSWAGRARLGAVLIETCATHDIGTPLHLEANRGWHPGNTLEALGYEVLDARGRLRVWQRQKLKGEPHASVLLCAYRTCSIPTQTAIDKLIMRGWRLLPKWGDGFIARSRAIVVSSWYRETADDVFLMLDDDICFEPWMAEQLVQECRNGHDIIHAAYPVRDGGHLAVRGLDKPIRFGPNEVPQEIKHASTGFLAVHRRVIQAMVESGKWPLCHANMPWAFWPLFNTFWIEDEAAGGWNYLSEDWAFIEEAHRLDFKVWLDPVIKLDHIAQIKVNVDNMHLIDQAVRMEVENG
jgi:hypothetical protein